MDSGESDGERETSRAGASGVEVKDTVAPLNGGPVGVAEDNRTDSGGVGMQIEVVDGMDQVEKTVAEFYDICIGKLCAFSCVVNVAAYGSDRSDSAKSAEDCEVADITGVEDVVNALKRCECFGTEQAVGV